MKNIIDLYACISDLINKMEYNKCENIIFEMLEKYDSDAIYEIALDFYNKLLEKSDEELMANNFSKIEIFQGLSDLTKIIFERKK